MGVSQIWKGVMWVARSVKFGYRWKIGDETKVRFWEDTWFGTSPLSVQYFDLYILSNEQGKNVSQLWDGRDLKLTFRRNFSNSLMIKLHELEGVAASITLSSETDALIWQYENNGEYSTSSLYALSILEELPLFSFLLFGNLLSLLECMYFFGSCLRIN
jgi:hypothetical protein